MKITRGEYIDDLAGSPLSREKFDAFLKTQNITYDVGEYDDYSYAVLNGFKGSRKDFNSQGESKYVTKIIGGTDKKIKELQSKIDDLDKTKLKLEELPSKVLSAVNNEIVNIKESQKEYNNKTIQNLGKKADKDHRHDMFDIRGLDNKFKSIESDIEDRPTRDEVAKTLDEQFVTKENTYTKEETRALLKKKLDNIIIPGSRGGGSGGASTFTGLTDTPDSYTGQANKVVSVKSDETGLQFTTLSGGGDMLKSVYDTDDDGIVNSSHKELVGFINKTGATLTKGTIVYLKSTSSSANYPEALKANASTEATSSKTLGAVFTDTSNDTNGYIVTSGEVDNLDTSGYSVGDKLWLSTTDGQVTTTAPTAPNHAVFIGTVTRSQSTNGRILYAIQNGYELEELHNVSTTTYTPIQDTDTFLVKDVTNSLWKPSTRSNIKSVLKTYLDTLYQPLSTVLTNTTESFTTALKSTYDSTASSLTTLLATGSRLITSTEITKLSNTSGTNTGDETTTTIGNLINGATEDTAPVDADMFGLMDSTASNILRKFSWANMKSNLKTYFDTLYAKIGATTSSGLTMSTARILGRSTAGTGAIEEITIGSNLTLSGGVLSASGGGSSTRQHRITIPGEQVQDTSNYQGLYLYNDTGSTITISNVAVAVGVAAAGTGAAYSINVYKSSGTAADGLNTNAVALFSSAIALGTSNTSLTNVPTTTTVESGRWVTMRVTSSAGSTNRAQDAQIIITYS